MTLEYKINPVDQNSVRRHMTALVEYVKAMRMSLQEINSHSYNNFMLRVGECPCRTPSKIIYMFNVCFGVLRH